MAEESVLTLALTREAAARLLDILRRPQTPGEIEDKNALCDLIREAVVAPRSPQPQIAREEAGHALAQAATNLAQAQDAYMDSLAQGDENQQRAACVAVGAGETRVRSAQAAYETAAQGALEAKAATAERERRAAYARSKKAHDEALSALRAYEPLAIQMHKLFHVVSAHMDLALADVEAADEARLNPHVANAVDFLRKIVQEQKLGHPEAVTKCAFAALRELELAAV